MEADRIRTMLRQTIPILLMPFMVVTAVPCLLLAAFAASDHRWSGGMTRGFFQFLGATGFLSGLGMFLWCVLLFAKVGKGTLAPWDPTRELVAVGPYGLVRNPMISSVAFMLLGEALFLGSWVCGLWCAAFLCTNHAYFVLSEEPGLEKRFGAAYQAYKRSVPRWIPRLPRRR